LLFFVGNLPIVCMCKAHSKLYGSNHLRIVCNTRSLICTFGDTKTRALWQPEGVSSRT